MFLFVLAKLLPERHNLYGNSLDFKLKYMREKKMDTFVKELSFRIEISELAVVLRHLQMCTDSM